MLSAKMIIYKTRGLWNDYQKADKITFFEVELFWVIEQTRLMETRANKFESDEGYVLNCVERRVRKQLIDTKWSCQWNAGLQCTIVTSNGWVW